MTSNRALTLCTTLVLACLGFAGASAHAAPEAGASKQMAVSAVIQRHASIRLAPPQTLTISEADVVRGYIEVAAPLEVTVQSNVREGYALVFQRDGAQVQQAVVQGLAAPVVVSGDSQTMARAGNGAGARMWQETLQLRVRFVLSAQARAGVHRWPLQISMLSM